MGYSRLMRSEPESSGMRILKKNAVLAFKEGASLGVLLLCWWVALHCVGRWWRYPILRLWNGARSALADTFCLTRSPLGLSKTVCIAWPTTSAVRRYGGTMEEKHHLHTHLILWGNMVPHGDPSFRTERAHHAIQSVSTLTAVA
jgi:hypothetical protein